MDWSTRSSLRQQILIKTCMLKHGQTKIFSSNELAQIEAVTTLHAKRWAVVPLQAEEPIGVERLKKLSRHTVS
ncbi:MAG: hypothetical protein K0U86_17930 [Planctomycetes bacterium]|nr:hypothetical protein [Planctomycetota bacterium]MCH9726786.1 hypothetical protein [Planctomycetota bacterium]